MATLVAFLSIKIKKRIIGLSHNHGALSSLLYKFIVNDITCTNNGKTYLLFKNVRKTLNECYLGYVWESQHFTRSRSTLLSFVEYMLKTKYIES